MFALLYDPLSEIKKCRSESFARILIYLLTASLFAACGLLFYGLRYASEVVSMSVLVASVVGFLFAFFLGVLFFALFFAMCLHVLDGKGGYYEGLCCLVLSFVPLAVCFFFGGALSFIPYGILASLLLFVYGFVLGAATLFRAGKELFGLDYAGVSVGVFSCLASLFFAVFAFVFLF